MDNEVCKYCRPIIKDLYGNAKGEYIKGLKDSNDGMWFVMMNGIYILKSHGSTVIRPEIKPNFCPMCGRALNNEIKEDEIYKKFTDKMEKQIIESCGVSSSLLDSSHQINLDTLTILNEEYLKNKRQIIMSTYVKPNEVMIIDCEQLHDPKLRGKIILCNPADYWRIVELGLGGI